MCVVVSNGILGWGTRALEYAYLNIVKVHARGKRRSRVGSAEKEDGELQKETNVGQDDEMVMEYFFDMMEKKINADETGEYRILKKVEGTRKRGWDHSHGDEEIARDLLPMVKVDKISPKLQKLFEILGGYAGQKEFCGIIFVEKRKAAQILHDTILHTPGLEFIRPAVLVGHGEGSKTFGSQMVSRDQERVVKMFREGRFNLLVATKVSSYRIYVLDRRRRNRYPSLQTRRSIDLVPKSD
jgi:hypothetical protein